MDRINPPESTFICANCNEQLAEEHFADGHDVCLRCEWLDDLRRNLGRAWASAYRLEKDFHFEKDYESEQFFAIMNSEINRTQNKLNRYMNEKSGQ